MTDTLPELVSEYLSHLRVDLLPIYIGLAGVVTWLGLLTVVVFAEAGVHVSEITRLSRLSLLLALTFGVLLPFGTPVAAMVGQRWSSTTDRAQFTTPPVVHLVVAAGVAVFVLALVVEEWLSQVAAADAPVTTCGLCHVDWRLAVTPLVIGGLVVIARWLLAPWPAGGDGGE